MDLPRTTSRGAGRGRSRPVRLLNVLENNFSSRVNTMLHDVSEDSDQSESEDIDDSDADPTLYSLMKKYMRTPSAFLRLKVKTTTMLTRAL